jgi:hypothetical protein
MSKTEELALMRIGSIGAAGLDAAPVIDDALVRAIVNDHRTEMHPMVGAEVMKPADARPLVTAGAGAGGWVDPPKLAAWRPPGLGHMDRMVDAADRIDRAEHVARLRRLGEGESVR